MLDGIPVIDGGASVILGVFVMLIFAGRVVAKRTVDDLRAEWSAQRGEMREEISHWRQTAENAVEAQRLQADASRQMADELETVVRLIQALRDEKDVHTT